MKRTLVALMMALVLALTALAGAAGETDTDLALLVEGTWDVTDIKGVAGQDDDQMSAAMEMIKAMGGTITMTFHNGTVTLDMQFMGQSQSENSTYSISGGQLIFAGAALDCSVSGDQMTLTDGSTTMVLTKSGSSDGTGLPAPTGSENNLVGSWKVVNYNVQEGSENTLAANIKPYMDEGNVFILTFNDNGRVNLVIEGGDGSLDDEDEYVVNGDQLTIAGVQTFTYGIVDYSGKTYLSLLQNQDELVLELTDEAGNNTKAPVPTGNGIEGSWKITAVTGSMEGVDQFNLILQMGGNMVMTFDNGNASMSIEFLGQSENQDLGSYTDTGSAIIMNGVTDNYTIDGDTLTLTENDMTMTMVRVR